MTRPSDSATHRVMRIPELRSLIFSFSTWATCLSNALVCKGWSDDALDVLWRDLDGPWYLFRLLAPLNLNNEGRYEFSRSLMPDDWLRFDKYAWRVLIIEPAAYSPFDVWLEYDSTVFTQLVAAQPRLLFPNLRTLYYDGPPQFTAMFLSPRIKTFQFTILSDRFTNDWDQLVSGVQATLPLVPKCSPLLETLVVNFRYPCIAALEVVLASILSSLPALVALHLPSGWLTKQVTHAVASHPRLHSVHSANRNYSAPVDRIKASDVFSSSLRPEDFPSLEDLALVIPFSRATQCLSGAYLPSTLTSLQLTSPTPDSPSIFGGLVDVVARGCPQLRRLELRVEGANMDASQQADFGTISPLLKCTQLKFLDLHHPNPFILTSGDVVSIVKALPSLESLSLNNAPVNSQSPTLRLSTLLQLAPICPNLYDLGLYIDATDPIEEIPDTHISRFPRLVVLSVGRSPISDAEAVATFLAPILPPGVAVDPTRSRVYPQTYSQWAEVDIFVEDIHKEQSRRDMALLEASH